MSSYSAVAPAAQTPLVPLVGASTLTCTDVQLMLVMLSRCQKLQRCPYRTQYYCCHTCQMTSSTSLLSPLLAADQSHVREHPIVGIQAIHTSALTTKEPGKVSFLLQPWQGELIRQDVFQTLEECS